jgi:hypothetical protein
MRETRQKRERQALKKRGKKLPHHVRRSASQLHRMKGLIENLLSPYTRNVKIYRLRASKKKS